MVPKAPGCHSHPYRRDTHAQCDTTCPCRPGASRDLVGVDTHRDTNVLAVVTAGGLCLATAAFPTTRAGIAAAIECADSAGAVTSWAIEGTGSYGGLDRALLAAGHRVVEVTQPNRRVRRQRGGKPTRSTRKPPLEHSSPSTAPPPRRPGRTVELLADHPHCKEFRCQGPNRLHQRTQSCAGHRTIVATRQVPRSHYPGANQEMRRSPRRRQRGRGRREADPAFVGAPLPAPQCRHR